MPYCPTCYAQGFTPLVRHPNIAIDKSTSCVKTYCRYTCADPRLVEFKSPTEAQAAINTLQNVDLMGRPIYLREDREASYGMPGAPGTTGRTGGANNCKVC